MSRNTPVVARSAAATLRARLWLMLGALAVAAGISQFRPVAAQESAEAAALSRPQLEELVGPIALYPDDLIAIVLPASSYPLQIVEAARFLDARSNDADLKPDEDWDDSVVALLNYPEVVRLLDKDLDWTWQLGTAVLNQRADVLDAIQGFRDRAYQAGNLQSDNRQVVTADEGTIAIAPADPEVIYVPYYEPQRVVVYQSAPVYHYYPWAYPVYYYPYPAGYAFSTGFFWGVTSAFAIGWHTHNLHVHYYGYAGHPYYGWNYYDPFYVRNNVYVNVNVNHGGDVWQPHHGYGGRPIVRGQEGRVADRNGSEPNASGGVARSTYRGQTQSPTNRTAETARTRADRGAGAVAGTQRTTTTTVAPRPSGSSGTRFTRPDQTGAPSTAATSNERSRVAPSPQAQARVANPRTPSPAETYRSTRVYRAAPPQATSGGGNANAPTRSYGGGGISSAAREANGGGGHSAPTPSSSGTAAPRSGDGGGGSGSSGSGGSYRGGSGQQHQATRGGGQGRAGQR